MFVTRSWLAAVALILGVVGVWGAAVPDTTEPVPQGLRDRILEIAAGYQRHGRVDDEFRWAPWLCRLPNPGQAHYSRSKDAATHGQKLYSLFAKDRGAYVALGAGKEAGKSPVGQVIIKESWVAEEMKMPPQGFQGQLKGQRLQIQPQFQQRQIQGQGAQIDLTALGALEDNFSPYAQKDGKWYHASKKAGLYIMLKVDPSQANTDQGWIYATTSADAKTVTAAGKIASCINCHEKAKHDRLFGLRGE